MKSQTIHMKDLLASGGATVKSVWNQEDKEEDFVDEAIVDDMESDVIPVSYVDVEKVVIPEIKDVEGRLSDIVESIETITGMSVVPLEMASIAPEVTKLQRHEIFELGGHRYAMSSHVRDAVILNYKEKIVNTLSRGLPFIENLSQQITYKGVDYKTFTLSRQEWTLLLSTFREYKGNVKIKNKTDLILEISTEHAI